MTKLLFEMAVGIVDSQMLDPGRVINIAHYALQCSALPGDMVEFGCYAGRTAAVLAHVVDKPLWLYDSFEGLPERAAQDAGAAGNFQRGSLKLEKAEAEVFERFEKHKLRKPNVYKGWFSAVMPGDLPERICFAHLDGDFYDSIRDSLRLVYPRLVPGAACIIDDYGWSGLPGVQAAVDEFMADKPEKAKPLVTGSDYGYHAVIIKI